MCIKQSLWALNRFPYTFCHRLSLKNIRRGYAQQKEISSLTQHQQVGGRLIKVENWDNKNCKGHT